VRARHASVVVIAVSLALGLALNSPRFEASSVRPHPVLTKGGASRITARLELAKTRAVAGTTIHGYLVIVNRGQSFPIADECTGLGPAVVVLVGSEARQEPVMFACVSAAVTTIAHGTTRIAVTITTTYTGCSSDAEQPQGQPVTTPPCLPPPQEIPPLRTGRYRTQVVWIQYPPPLPVPGTIVITLTD
jgi:hypothetical protein